MGPAGTDARRANARGARLGAGDRRGIAVERVPRDRPRPRGPQHARSGRDTEEAVLASLPAARPEPPPRPVGGLLAEALRELGHDPVQAALLADAREVALRALDPVEEPRGPSGMAPPAVGEVLLRLHGVRDPQEPGPLFDERGHGLDHVDEHLEE